jgi:hypothetical protein
MAKAILLAILSAALYGCTHTQLPVNGANYPYQGPMIDNTGTNVPIPQYRGAP